MLTMNLGDHHDAFLRYWSFNFYTEAARAVARQLTRPTWPRAGDSGGGVSLLCCYACAAMSNPASVCIPMMYAG